MSVALCIEPLPAELTGREGLRVIAARLAAGLAARHFEVAPARLFRPCYDVQSDHGKRIYRARCLAVWVLYCLLSWKQVEIGRHLNMSQTAVSRAVATFADMEEDLPGLADYMATLEGLLAPGEA